jgi:hypothetical protein
VKTGQQFISLHDDQIPGQNCTIVQYFVVHAAHGPWGLVGKLVKSSFQCNKCWPVWSFRLGGRPVLVKTGQQFISLHDDQIPVQNCTIVQYFVVHAAHGVKAY